MEKKHKRKDIPGHLKSQLEDLNIEENLLSRKTQREGESYTQTEKNDFPKPDPLDNFILYFKESQEEMEERIIRQTGQVIENALTKARSKPERGVELEVTQRIDSVCNKLQSLLNSHHIEIIRNNPSYERLIELVKRLQP